MNRCGVCGRKIQNAETTDGIEVCKICLGYEEQILEKDKEIERLRNCVMTEEQVKQIMQEGMYETMVEQFENGAFDKQLKSLAIKTLEDILNKFDFYENSQKDTMIPAIAGNVSIIEYITNIIKGLKGEEDDQ